MIPGIFLNIRLQMAHFGVTKIFSRDDISNYRPISVLLIASKILEKHVSIHFYEYMTSYSLHHRRQSGFRAYPH